MVDTERQKTCRLIGDVLAFLDGRLSPAERDRFEEHLSGCSACREELEPCLKLRRLLGQAAEEPLPALDLKKVSEGLFFEKSSTGRRRLVPALALSAAAAALVALFLLWPRPTPSPPPVSAGPSRLAVASQAPCPALVSYMSAGARGPRFAGNRWILDSGVEAATGKEGGLALRVASRVSLVLLDGGRAIVRWDEPGAVRADLKAGTLVARLAQPPGMRFSVKTAAGTVEATGTAFVVRVSGEQQVQLWLFEGWLQARPEGGSPDSLEAPAYAELGLRLLRRSKVLDAEGRAVFERAEHLDPFSGTQLGWVSLESEPVGAEVLAALEGFSLGRTPLVLARPGDELAVRLRAEGRVETDAAIRLRPDHLVSQRFELAAERPPAGKLQARLAGDPLARVRRLLAARKLEEATREIDRYLSVKPDDPRAIFLLGDARRLLGQPGEALLCYQRVGEQAKDPRLSEAALYEAGRLQLHPLGQPREALQTFQRLMQDHPKGLLRHEVAYHLAESHIALKEFPEAVLALRRYLQDYPQGTKAKEAKTLLEALLAKGWR